MGNRTKAYILIVIMILAISAFFVPGCTLSSRKPGSSYEELLKIIPPPPLNLSGMFKGDHIELRWDTPETVNFHHGYSDVITGYIIYKGTNANIVAYLATTAELTFKDSAISGSPQYAYEVTALHQGNTESIPSQDVIVRTSIPTPMVALSGISYEEQMRILPPPPRTINGTCKVDHIELRWDVPETVRVPHGYSDVITGYKIYKGTSVDKMSYLATTADLNFKDFDISGSPQYAYEVTAVHQGSTESVPSQEIFVRTTITIPSGGKVK